MMDMNSERDFLFAFANDIVATWVLKALHELKISVKVLFDLIRKSHKSQLKVQVPFSLVERESCVGVK